MRLGEWSVIVGFPGFEQMLPGQDLKFRGALTRYKSQHVMLSTLVIQ